MHSSNPALSDSAFRRIYATEVGAETMTMDGAVKKTGILFGLLVSTAIVQWYLMLYANVTFVVPMATMIGGMIGGLVLSLITIFKPQFAPVTAPLYALFEGFIIGGISVLFEFQYPGIVLPAMGLTFGVMAMMLTIYVSRIIKVTDKFRFGLTMAIGGVFMIYFITIILSFFGIYVPFVFSGGPFGVLFSLFVVGLASLSLLLDFDMIERSANARAPKFMEWYGAFALMVTLLWLYVEILRLLAKSRN